MPVVHWIQRLRIRSWSPGRGTATLIFFAAILAAVSVFAGLALPPISRDAQHLSEQLPGTINEVRQRVEALPFGRALAQRVRANSLQNWLASIVQTALGAFRGFAGGAIALLTVLLVMAYFMLDGGTAFEWALAFIPARHRQRLRVTLLRAADRAQHWLIGQLILMAILSSLTAIALGLMGVRYFYALAVFAGLANFVPILGPIATVLLAGMIAAPDSWTKCLGVVIFYLVYQQIENVYLSPRIMKSTVHLPGIGVIIALVIGGALAGLLGAMVAVPTAALVATILSEYAQDKDDEAGRLLAA